MTPVEPAASGQGFLARVIDVFKPRLVFSVICWARLLNRDDVGDRENPLLCRTTGPMVGF